ncbi:hypothetical protein RRG08_026913 [Elysia crispata]|uniref:Uncharacterized protein n=1 Tax=Elysia crispata TaxID=231223 RepID=A0AAE1DJ62_9GAST|nr:hypothetical protein RRG08_026913 [Elysia crispata]
MRQMDDWLHLPNLVVLLNLSRDLDLVTQINNKLHVGHRSGHSCSLHVAISKCFDLLKGIDCAHIETEHICSCRHLLSVNFRTTRTVNN